MICPMCSDTVSELIEHRQLGEPVCYYCASELLGVPRNRAVEIADETMQDLDDLETP
jgi:ribosomal protein L34E